jgi:2-hydroxychromene-2-carboxylate isomerase
MDETIDYFFTTVSPFVYLGHRELMRIAKRHGKKVAFRPFTLPGVWEHSGSVPLPQRSPIRQRYRLVELQRLAEWRGVPLKLKPAFFPADPACADLCCVALDMAGKDPADFALAAGSTVWAEDRNIADEAVIADLLAKCGHDARQVIEASKSEAAAARRLENTQAAVAADAIGAPAYVWRGETFWGQDRLELLDRMIESGRPAFRADA